MRNVQHIDRQAHLSAQELSLTQLLTGTTILRIPDFQRPYSWTAQQARQLLDDICRVASYGDQETPAPPYFLGPIMLLDHGADNTATAVAPGQPVSDIVDGQQRLVTLSILIACLRDLDDGTRREALHGLLALTEMPDAFQLAMRGGELQTLLEDRILKPGATRRRGPPLSGATAADNLISNRNLLMRELRSLTPAERDHLADYLLHGCRLLVMRTADIDYAYQIFLTINDRGLGLTPEDILRGELIGPLRPEQQARFDAVLAEFDRYQSENRGSRSKKGKTFFSHLAAIHGTKGKSIIAEIRRLVRDRGGPTQFGAQVFVPMAEAYQTVKKPPDHRASRSAELEDYLAAFRIYEAFGDDDWVPVAMLWLTRFGADETATIAFFRTMDRFALALRAIGAGYPLREKRYGAVRDTLLAATAPPDAHTLFALSASEQRLAINCIAKRCWKSDAQLARLVLMRLDAHLSKRPLALYEATLQPNAYTVEHVLPQAQTPMPPWPELYPDKRRRLLLAQCLGNLVLVPPAINAAAAARPFAEKRRIYFADGPSPFVLTGLLQDPELVEWTETVLVARQTQLVAAAQEIWEFGADLTRLVV